MATGSCPQALISLRYSQAVYFLIVAITDQTPSEQIHVHDLSQLSLSFARHTTSLNQTFVLVGSGYEKSVHLQTDRKLEFHTPSGCHFETRLPRYGRDLIYDRSSTEALVPSAGVDVENRCGEVFRLNLELGRFMKSYQVDVGEDEPGNGLQGSIGVGCVNVAAIAENTHGLLAFGTSISTVEFWDPRSKSRVAILSGHDGEITALDFSPTGLSLATGTSTGLVQLFDLRRPVPLLKKDQGYGFPIQNIIHLQTASQERKILSSDKKVIKIWDEATGEPWTSVEPIVDLHHVAHVKGSGMLLTANEGKQMHSFFIPQLGPAPRWCSFLDNMVEELAEEVHTETYDDYKFLTMPELKSLSLAHLVGKSNLLRPYMHGYFVASKLYEQARLIANPYVWEEERVKRIKEKVEKERASRIRGSKKVKVNQKLADKILKRQEKREEVDTEAGILGDSRFAKLFEDEEFFVDENSFEFRALNPSTKVAGPETTGDKKAMAPGSAADSTDESDNDVDSKDPPVRQPEMIMRVSSSDRARHSQMKDTALGSRVLKSGRVGKPGRGDVVGERQVTFVPESKKKGRPAPSPPTKKRSDSRRSASNNTFRRL